MSRWIKLSLIGFSLILLVAATLAWFVLMTAPGARLALGFVEPRIPGALSYEELNGRLVGPLELEDVRYEHETLVVRVERLAVDWQPLALLEKRVHIDMLRLQGVDGRFDPEAPSGDGEDGGSGNGEEGQEAGSEPGGLTLGIEVGDLQATDVRFVAGDWAALRQTSLAASGTLDDFTVRIEGQLIADPLPISTVDIAGNGNLTRFSLESFHLASEAGAIDASGRVEWQPGLTWDLVVRGDSLAPGAMAEDPADWPGWLTLEASTMGSVHGGTPAADIAVDTLYGSVRGFPISGRAALEIAGSRILVPDTDLEWGLLAIRADGVYADTIDFAFEIKAPDLSGVLPNGRGSVRAEGRASGPRSTPHVEASLSARDAAFGEITLRSAEGRVVLDLSSSGAVDAAVLMSGLETPQIVIDELDAAVRGRVDAHRLSLRAGNDQYALALRGGGGVAGEAWRGEIEELGIETPRVGDWSLRAPVSLALAQGKASLSELCMGSDDGELCAAGEFAGADSWQAVAALEGIPLSVARPFLPPELTLEGTVDASLDLAAGETALPTGRADISLSSGYAEVVVGDDTLRVVHGGDLKLISSADTLAGDLDATLALSDGEGTAWIAVGFSVSDVLSVAEQGDPLAALARGDWKADASIEDLKLASLETFLPSELGIDGSLDATLDATADAGRVRGVIVVEPSTGSMALAGETETDSLEFRELSVRITADDMGVKGGMRFSVHGLGGGSLGGMQVEARSDAIVLGQPLADRAVEAVVEGSFDLAALTTLTHGFVEATGSADLDFSLNRDSGDFEALGQARVRGRADVEVLGIALEDLDLSVDADGERLVIDGRVSSGEGQLTLSGEKVWGESTSMQLQGARFLAIARDELRLEIAPDLQLEARGTRIDLSGEVVVPSARIELLEVPSTGVGVSDDVVLVGVEAEPEITEPIFVETFTDVTLSLGDEVSFRGFGLTTMIDGSLRVTDQPGTPTRADGVLSLRDGRFRGFGLNLVVDPGELVFAGPLDEPRLRVTAYREADDGTRAGLAINGPADSPRLEIYSEPTVSDEEALSYMFSGQPLDRGSTQLNRANAQQAQTEGGGALMGSNALTQAAGMAIGLDETRIDAGDRREDAEFIAGKYISPRLYVAYVTGLFEAVNVLRVRYTLYKGFRLQVETGTRQTVDLLYRFDVGK
jgi:translocation and assembly module TamB